MGSAVCCGADRQRTIFTTEGRNYLQEQEGFHEDEKDQALRQLLETSPPSIKRDVREMQDSNLGSRKEGIALQVPVTGRKKVESKSQSKEEKKGDSIIFQTTFQFNLDDITKANLSRPSLTKVRLTSSCSSGSANSAPVENTQFRFTNCNFNACDFDFSQKNKNEPAKSKPRKVQSQLLFETSKQSRKKNRSLFKDDKKSGYVRRFISKDIISEKANECSQDTLHTLLPSPRRAQPHASQEIKIEIANPIEEEKEKKEDEFSLIDKQLALAQRPLRLMR
jgi:hypothetical protein